MKFKIIIMALVAFFIYSSVSMAAEITLAWDANSETDLAGYKLYYDKDVSGPEYIGIGINEGDSPIEIPLFDLSDTQNPQFKVTGLTTGTYYFVVTAYDNVGNESGYSNEVNPTVDTSAPSNPSGLNVTVIVHVVVE